MGVFSIAATVNLYQPGYYYTDGILLQHMLRFIMDHCYSMSGVDAESHICTICQDCVMYMYMNICIYEIIIVLLPSNKQDGESGCLR